MKPILSIVVPTINREVELRELLKSFIGQIDHNKFEVIIVDQNLNLDLSNLIEEFRRSIQIKHIKTKPRGASGARNVGIENSEGEYIAFPDDDCIYPDGFLNDVICKLNKPSDYVGICIITRDKNDNKSIAKLKSKSVLLKKSNLLSTVIEAGIIIKKEAIGSVRFDEKMGVGSLYPFWSDEGPDFILRILEKGKKVMYMPDIYMYHPNPVKNYNEKTAKRAYDYGLGRGYFLRKNNYPFYVFLKFILIYIVGYCIGFVKVNKGMKNYFVNGIIGRYKGYYAKT